MSYMKQIIDRMLLAQAQGRKPPALYHVQVNHNEWCDLITGKGDCNCTPDISPSVPHRESWYATGGEK
jgi:hypothetical protein